MKVLFDLFPVLLFFVAYKFADIYVATGVAMAASVAQIAYLKIRGRKVEPMLWISLVLIMVFGGATIFFHNETFVKWKPSVLYWLFAVVLAGGQLFAGKNFIRMLMEKQIQLPDGVWNKMNWSWSVFFLLLGALNLYIAYAFPTDVWVNFKVFGATALMLVFVLGQGFALSKYVQEPAQEQARRDTQ